MKCLPQKQIVTFTVQNISRFAVENSADWNFAKWKYCFISWLIIINPHH